MTSVDSETDVLDSQLLETVTIQGRHFQKYSINRCISLVPIDDEEADRLEIQHLVFQRVFDDRYIFPPIDRLRRVLDCGYGAGTWALETAERYEDAEIIGIDISPHMNPDDIPENLWLQVDDLNRPFSFPQDYFDFVHSSLVATGINKYRWQTYFKDIKRILRPGGWMQVVEIYYNIQSDNGSITENHALRQWSLQLMDSLKDIKDLRVGTRLKTLVSSARMEDVDIRMLPLPLSPWSNDPKMKEIGVLNRENLKRLFRSLSLFPLTQIAHMPQDKFDDLITRAVQEAENPSLKAYFPVYVCVGRKGEDSIVGTSA